MKMDLLGKPSSSILAAIRATAYPLTSDSDDRQVLELIADAPLVLLGEATHGTPDFYEARARITRKLIEERDFSAVEIEGDWPDALRVGRYVHGTEAKGDAKEALAGFTRFPTWMWRNSSVERFVSWLRLKHFHPESNVPLLIFDLTP